MQDKGLLQRTHGGAIPVDKPEQPKSTRDFSEIENYEAKLKVARLAASTIKMGIISPLAVELQLIFLQHAFTIDKILPS